MTREWLFFSINHRNNDTNRIGTSKNGINLIMGKEGSYCEKKQVVLIMTDMAEEFTYAHRVSKRAMKCKTMEKR